MRILMIAPEPFFEPRGTPFSVFHRARALGRMGHTVDLVTYPIGAAVDLPNVTVHRALGVPGVKRVKIGPSLVKLPLDALLFLKVIVMLLTHRYDCIHTHEEAGVFGVIFSRLTRLPHIYDMHSDLAQQMTNFKFTRNKMLIGLMHAIETTIIRSASVVIVICPELQEAVAAIDPKKPTVLIENTAVAAEGAEQQSQSALMAPAVERLRRELDLPPGIGPVFVYTGTFESYQGLDLVVESMPIVLARYPTARYVLVGGRPDQVETVLERAHHLGVEHALRLTGQRPPEEMPVFMLLADILLSPRSEGTNTPLKIYSYLHSGIPILATNIRSHTQVLTSDVAMLTAPSADALARGALMLAYDDQLRRQLSTNAQALARARYSYETYITRTTHAYDLLMPAIEGKATRQEAERMDSAGIR